MKEKSSGNSIHQYLDANVGFFGSGSSNKVNKSLDGRKDELVPTLKVQTDKDVYRPGDSVLITIEISNPKDGASEDVMSSLLIEKLGFEIRGIQKLDSQWFATQKPLPGSKQRRGLYCVSVRVV
ncbi:unnamed protein product [Dovyalis caffra]|uniref:Uncharacterized protein n=1 Tax=Dovyalis caffra TaxID=77055 RepID=A0AAV1RQK5_9ROSI|nr:unnamed protein product [Dovyalis caffra]